MLFVFCFLSLLFLFLLLYRLDNMRIVFWGIDVGLVGDGCGERGTILGLGNTLVFVIIALAIAGFFVSS